MVGIYTPRGVERLNKLLKSSHRHAISLQSLTVCLSAPPEMRALQNILRLSVNMESLNLILPSAFHTGFLATMGPLARLATLETNIPHAVLAGLLQRQPEIETLVIGVCDNHSYCPLSAVGFPSLRHVTSPIACIPAFEGAPRLVTLSARYIDHRDAELSASKTLRFLTPHSDTITSITLEFNPTDYDVLRRIADIAPRLEGLKLVEKYTNIGLNVRCYTLVWFIW